MDTVNVQAALSMGFTGEECLTSSIASRAVKDIIFSNHNQHVIVHPKLAVAETRICTNCFGRMCMCRYWRRLLPFSAKFSHSTFAVSLSCTMFIKFRGRDSGADAHAF